MNNALADSWFMTVGHLRNTFRQPAWIAISLIQPVVWLLLYGALFRKIVEIPGFGADSYIDFLTPGIVVMTCLFSAGWSGMGLIDDLDRGVVDRFLVSPASRSSLIAGRLTPGAMVGVIQAVIIIVLGLMIGATYPGGIAGLTALTVCAVLLGAAIGALSNGVALLSRREETMIAVSDLVLLPHDVSVVGVHGAGAHASANAVRGQVQPGQLGGAGWSRRARRGLGRRAALPPARRPLVAVGLPASRGAPLSPGGRWRPAP